VNDATSTPYLSIVLVGRNDNFGDDFNERLFAAAEFNHAELERYGVPHEYIFVEWNPIPGKPYLAELIGQRLPWWRRRYVVDAAWHQHFSVNPKLVFMEFFAKNVGIRRTAGRFVLVSNTDIWLSRGILRVLAAGHLSKGVLYRCVRVDLRREIGYFGMTFDVLEHPESFLRTNPLMRPHYSNASGDFLLMDRDSWATAGGFNEVFRESKIHKDSNLCAQVERLGLPIEVIGEVYHFDHEHSFNNVAHLDIYGPNHRNAPFGRSDWDWTERYTNDESWGLADAREESRQDGVSFLPKP